MSEPVELDTVERAGPHRKALGAAPGWESLTRYLPAGTLEALASRQLGAVRSCRHLRRCSRAGRQGVLVLRQNQPFGPIYLKPSGNRPGAAVIGAEGSERRSLRLLGGDSVRRRRSADRARDGGAASCRRRRPQAACAAGGRVRRPWRTPGAGRRHLGLRDRPRSRSAARPERRSKRSCRGRRWRRWPSSPITSR